jgi:5-(carboxyamino)imidazole ribonucleotide mutase
MNIAAQALHPIVGIVMGSNSDWEVMSAAADILQEFDVAHESLVLSAHRMPDDMFAYAQEASSRGLQAIIAGAANAALHVIAMFALHNPDLQQKLVEFRLAQTNKAKQMTLS